MIRAVSEWIIRKRDGRTVPFDAKLIHKAICNAFRAELNLAAGQPLDGDIEREVGAITGDVMPLRIAVLVSSRFRTWLKCS